MQLVSRINSILLLEDQLQWAIRPIITTQTVRRRGLPPEWATRPTTIMQMGHLPDRLLRWAGSETLENGGDWLYLPNSLHKFFKVSVEVP